MKKLKLEDLKVESFSTGEFTGRGTVEGHGEGSLFDWTCNVSACNGSCDYTCAAHCTAMPENTCYSACLSNAPGCEPSKIWEPNGRTCITEPY